MNASAIYSKSGKGVQEAAGKTSHLSRPDRAVLSAIDGRATLAEVAQKVGKPFDPAFQKLVEQLDKGGFIREVSAGAPGAAPKISAAPKPAAKSLDPASDLDFTAALQMPRGSGKTQPPPQAPPKPAPPAKPAMAIPPAPPPPSAAEQVKAEKAAKEQQDAFARAREEAEQKAQAERDRLKAEAEAKVRAETEAKMRAEAKDAADKKLAAELEAKAKAEADAKIKAARDAAAKVAAEAKAKAEAEAERLRREQEELKRKLEEERKAREEAERKAKEEARRLEEERRKLEEERRQREEEKRREEAERAERRKREEEEEKRERAERAERRKREEEEEARQRAERKRREEAEDALAQARRKAQAAAPDDEKPKPRKDPEPAQAAAPAAPVMPAAPPAGGGFSDSLLADLDSFTTRDDEEQKEREATLLKEKEAAAQRAREAEEHRQKEEAERQEKEEKKRRKEEERERKAKEEAELREAEAKEKARLAEEEEKRRREAEEREKKAKQEERLAAGAQRGAQYDAAARSKREAALQARPVRGRGGARAARGGWGKPIAITLFVLLVIAVGVAHVMPIDTADHERAATEALGQPVRIGSANLSLIGGLQLKFYNVSLGDAKVVEVRGFPELDALLGPKKSFSRIEIDGAKLDQALVGQALFAKVRTENFRVERIVAKNLELTGPLALPKNLELDVTYDDNGMVRNAFLRGPESLVAKLSPKGGSSIEVDMSASTFTLPFAPEVSFGRFSLKGSIGSQGMSVSEWDAAVLNGTLSGTANVSWGDNWVIEGVLTARNINAAVFAPALVSDGRAEGSGKFSMRSAQPAKLGDAARIDGTFTVSRGVLGSFDLARAVQSQGKAATGRTQFAEMTGNGVYDRGAVSLRNVTISAGQLNAGASADIAQNGALSGRIVADVRIASQQQRAVLNLGGTVREPQVRN